MNQRYRKRLPGTALDYFDAREAVEALDCRCAGSFATGHEASCLMPAVLALFDAAQREARAVRERVGFSEASNFAKAAQVMANFAIPLDLPELILGGGLGVAYVEGEEAPSITQWGNVLLDACQALGVRSRVSVEPGRSIVASAAITVRSSPVTTVALCRSAMIATSVPTWCSPRVRTRARFPGWKSAGA